MLVLGTNARRLAFPAAGGNAHALSRESLELADLGVERWKVVLVTHPAGRNRESAVTKAPISCKSANLFVTFGLPALVVEKVASEEYSRLGAAVGSGNVTKTDDDAVLVAAQLLVGEACATCMMRMRSEG